MDLRLHAIVYLSVGSLAVHYRGGIIRRQII